MHNKWQEEYITCFIIFGLLIAFSVFILRQYFYTSEKALDVINAAILFWTGIVIVIYTRETYRLRVAAQKQVEIQQRPFVIFETGDFKDEQGKVSNYRVRNIGTSTAINVHVMDIYPEDSDSYYRIRFCTHHQGLVIPSLLPQEVSYLHTCRILKDENISRKNPIIEGLIDCSFSTRVLFSN